MWREQRPGYLEIHRDMVERRIPVPPEFLDWDGSLPHRPLRRAQVAEAVRETAARINAARRPLVTVGIETFRYRLQRDVLRLAEKIGAPVATTVLVEGRLSRWTIPLFMGVHIGGISPTPILRRVDRADLVLNLGAMRTDMDLGARPPPVTRDRSIWAVDGRVERELPQLSPRWRSAISCAGSCGRGCAVTASGSATPTTWAGPGRPPPHRCAWPSCCTR